MLGTLRMGGLTAVAVALIGCSTPYQSYGLRGGFEETQLAPNAWRVSFTGNGFTGSEEAQNYVLLRSAELALATGYSYFGVASGSANMNPLGTYTAPSTTTTTGSANLYGGRVYGSATSVNYGGMTAAFAYPTANNLVVMFKDRPDTNALIFDAAFICRSVGAKYKVTCGKG